jgi:hypothetical protein
MANAYARTGSIANANANALHTGANANANALHTGANANANANACPYSGARKVQSPGG